jgi:nucleotide-binding universal stress UspA family protein
VIPGGGHPESPCREFFPGIVQTEETKLSIPNFILKEGFMFNVDNIIVPTDFSDYSDLAFKRALDLAEACDAKIYLIHVVADAPDIFKLDRFNVEGQKKIMKDLEKQCQDSFEEQIGKFPQSQKVETETKVLRGIPSREIIDIQKKINADMIVIATHGQSAFEEFLFGNTATKIIRYSKCSVLVVRKPKYS